MVDVDEHSAEVAALFDAGTGALDVVRYLRSKHGLTLHDANLVAAVVWDRRIHPSRTEERRRVKYGLPAKG